MTDRHRALVTAPFRGPGLDTLRSLADVVLDPWIDHQPLRLYNADDARRAGRGRGRRPPHRRVRQREGPGPRPAAASPSARAGATPTTSTSPPPPRRASRCCGRPGATPTPSPRWPSRLLFAVNRGIVRADLDVRAGEIYRDGTIPYQRFRAWQLAGQTAGIVGLGAVGRAAAVALRGPRHEGHQLRPVRPRRHPLARRPARRSRRRVDARGGHARDGRA